jgi:hypothetical protein
MARAQQQGSAPPPATGDPQDLADRRPTLAMRDFTTSICRPLTGEGFWTNGLRF